MNYYVDIMDFKEYIEAGYDYADVLINESTQTRLNFTKQKTGYGFKHFFICPVCGTRRSKLYQHQDKYICRTCYPHNVYRTIQNVPKGGNKYIGYRMKRYAEAHNIELKRFPFNYAEYEKPINRKGNGWADELTVLQALENMRYQTYSNNKRWSSKTINSVINWNNSLLYLFDLSEILDNCIHWDKGLDMNTDL